MVTHDGVLVFTRRDGRRVEENGAKCFRGNISTPHATPSPGFEETLRLYLLNRDAGLAITRETGRCQWRGESMDYSQAIEAMQSLEHHAPQRQSSAHLPVVAQRPSG